MRGNWSIGIAGALTAVALAAGCGGSSGGTTSGGGGSGGGIASVVSSAASAAGAAQTVEIDVAPSGLAFTKTQATAAPGLVTLRSKNPQSLGHDISIKGNGVSAQGNIVSSGGVSTVTATLAPGTYTFYCSVDGHETAGMKGTLTVQ